MIRGCLWNWAPWIYNKLGATSDVLTRIFRASCNEIRVSNKWCITKGLDVPIYSSFFQNIPDSIISWTCTTNPVRFTSPGLIASEYKHISYLGCTVNIPGYDPIDLTEWINTVQWSGITEPSMKEIFQIWCCETGNSYFHLIPYIQVKLINEMGDEIIKGLNDSSITTCSTNGGSRYQLERSNTDRSLDALLSSSGC